MTLIKKKIIFPYSKSNICSYIEQINTRPKVLNYCSWGKTDVTKKGLEFLDQTFRVHGSTSLLKTAEGTYLSCVPKWTVTASQWARLDQQKLRLWWWEKKIWVQLEALVREVVTGRLWNIPLHCIAICFTLISYPRPKWEASTQKENTGFPTSQHGCSFARHPCDPGERMVMKTAWNFQILCYIINELLCGRGRGGE